MNKVVGSGIFLPLFDQILVFTTGKIAATVNDIQTGNPLTEVNIQLLGTQQNAVNDQKGSFLIINVPPKIYRIRATMIGFNEVVLKISPFLIFNHFF